MLEVLSRLAFEFYEADICICAKYPYSPSDHSHSIEDFAMPNRRYERNEELVIWYVVCFSGDKQVTDGWS